MKFQTALAHFKSIAALASAADCTPQAVYKWKRAGIVPKRSAWILRAKMKAAAGAGA